MKLPLFFASAETKMEVSAKKKDLVTTDLLMDSFAIKNKFRAAKDCGDNGGKSSTISLFTLMTMNS